MTRHTRYDEGRRLLAATLAERDAEAEQTATDEERRAVYERYRPALVQVVRDYDLYLGRQGDAWPIPDPYREVPPQPPIQVDP